MTDTTTLEATSGASPRRSGALTAMRLAELQGLASSMGITGTAKMRKGDLVAAIKARQNGESGPASAAPPRRAGRPAGSATSAGRTPRSETTESIESTERTQSPEPVREERGDLEEQAERD
ncbi:MAG: Rho termination factor N-terminal domain-containing protein, partial [Ornithinibacter sp.]